MSTMTIHKDQNTHIRTRQSAELSHLRAHRKTTLSAVALASAPVSAAATKLTLALMALGASVFAFAVPVHALRGSSSDANALAGPRRA